MHRLVVESNHVFIVRGFIHLSATKPRVSLGQIHFLFFGFLKLNDTVEYELSADGVFARITVNAIEGKTFELEAVILLRIGGDVLPDLGITLFNKGILVDVLLPLIVGDYFTVEHVPVVSDDGILRVLLGYPVNVTLELLLELSDNLD